MNILQAVVRTLRQPDGIYRLPDGGQLAQHVCRATVKPWWTVCCRSDGTLYWLNRALVWESPYTWSPDHDWGPDFGFTTPEDAYFAWLQWLDGVEEG